MSRNKVFVIFSKNGERIEIYKGEKGFYLLSPQFTIVDKSSVIVPGNIHNLQKVKEIKDKRGKVVPIIRFIDTGKKYSCIKHKIDMGEALNGNPICEVCGEKIDLSPFYVYARKPVINKDWLEGKVIEGEPWNAFKREIETISINEDGKHHLTPHSEEGVTTFSEVVYKEKVNIGNPVFENMLKAGKIRPEDVKRIVEDIEVKIMDRLREARIKASEVVEFPSPGEMFCFAVMASNWLEILFLRDPRERK